MKRVVCIFAHPDDESFGPSGTIAKFAADCEVYLICATSGEKGEHKDNRNLGEIRREETRKAAHVLGVKEVFFLGFKDGTLCNNLYHKLAGSIKKHLDTIKPDTLLSTELHGVSGHIDHIVTAMVSSYLFQKLSYVKTIYYHCLDEKRRSFMGDDYFVYVPPGYKLSEIDEIVDISPFWEQKINAIKCHRSQSRDMQYILDCCNNVSKEEHFLVLKK